MKKGFTLSEVLITLGIIGVVAALTLPSVIQKHQEQATVAGVKKAYSVLSQAFQMAINDNGTVDNWCSEEDLKSGVTCSYRVGDIIKPYLKKIKECAHWGELCIASGYKSRFNDLAYPIRANGPNFITADGIAFVISASADVETGRWCLSDTNSIEGSYEIGTGYRQTGACGAIWVDINGMSPPNTMDKDLFKFRIFRNGIAPNGLPADKVWVNEFESQCLGKRYYNGGACAGWVVINGNLDYLHCDDLSWGGKHKCK